MTRIELYIALLTFTCAYAGLYGGKPERYVALVNFVGVMLTILVASPLGTRFSSVEIGILLVDFIALLLFVFIAISAERFWTLWIAAMQVIQVLTHLPILFIPELLPQAYGAVVAIWAYPMLGVLMLGTYRHQQRLKQFGTDKSWSSF